MRDYDSDHPKIIKLAEKLGINSEKKEKKLPKSVSSGFKNVLKFLNY